MDIRVRHTKHQVARGSRPDAETRQAVYLLKNVSTLRLTYQIRLLAFRAQDTARRLVIRVPRRCQLHPALRHFCKEYEFVRVERV